MLMLTYVLIVDRWVLVDRPVPFPYRQFLLEASGEVAGKIVIESGSNGLHGIDAKALSGSMGAPVIIVSDAAAYPLSKKLLRLEDRLQSGDLLLLPLEWDFYSSTGALTKSFVQRVANKDLHLAHYISNLSPIETLQFILREYPLRNAFESLWLSRDADEMQQEGRRRLKRFERILRADNNTSFGGMERDGPEKFNPIAALSGSCDRYLFERDGALRMSVSDTFRENLERLKALQKKGVSVLFTWPAVVDDQRSKCYSDPEVVERLDAYVAEIQGVVEAEGFEILGRHNASHFPQECVLDTYYHIRWSCAKERTELLISDLRNADIESVGGVVNLAEFEALLHANLQSRLEDIQRNRG